MEHRDPAKVASKHYWVVFENERVRVLENRMKPKEKTEVHSHPACLGIFVTGAKLRFTSPDGKTGEASGKAGEVAWFEATTHTTENVGKNEVHSFIVEFKGL